LSDRLFLCATTRLAQTLRGEVQGGQTVWRTCHALTLPQWLGSLTDEALLSGVAELPAMLDPFAERLLWEKVIAASLTEAALLFDIQGMAASAAEAHALSCIWNIQPASAELSDEAQLFIGWQRAFEKHCQAAGWLDAASLHLRLIGLIEAGHFTLPEAVVFAGFDRYTPLEQRLMAALSGRGVALEKDLKNTVDRSIDGAATTSTSAPTPSPASTAITSPAIASDRQRVLACADSAAECAAVAAWAKAHLVANPAARLGVVAPDLAGVRDRLEFRLDDVLHPALIRPDAAEVPRCFNFSLGRGLADLPLIRSALDLLALGGGRGKVEQSRLSALLLAGAWGAGEAEADGRARLDTALRRDLPYFTTLPALIRLADWLADAAPPLCPQSMAALAAFVEVMSRATKAALPSAWAPLFQQALQAVGWPGDRALSSHEFQAHRAFGEVLDSFGRFDSLLGPLVPAEAVRRLSQLCRQRLFPAGNCGPSGHSSVRRARKRRPWVRCAVGHGHERRPLAAGAAAESALASRTAAGGRRGPCQRRG
jgi:probable DNA repair protein